MNPPVPSGTELARPFLPSKDFEVSKRFYEALGFTKVMDGEVGIFRIGGSGFILQRYFQKEWAENFMMHLMVDDLDAWWAHITSLDLPSRFGVSTPKAPALILDPYCGSGPVGVAAVSLGFRYIGSDCFRNSYFFSTSQVIAIAITMAGHSIEKNVKVLMLNVR